MVRKSDGPARTVLLSVPPDDQTRSAPAAVTATTSRKAAIVGRWLRQSQSPISAIPITSAVRTYENVTPRTMIAPAMNAGIVRRLPTRIATRARSRNAA
jgi:hypothetical protein